jgi:hypothetical protein
MPAAKQPEGKVGVGCHGAKDELAPQWIAAVFHCTISWLLGKNYI